MGWIVDTGGKGFGVDDRIDKMSGGGSVWIAGGVDNANGGGGAGSGCWVGVAMTTVGAAVTLCCCVWPGVGGPVAAG